MTGLDRTLRRLAESSLRRDAWRSELRAALLRHCLVVGGTTVGRDDEGLSWAVSVDLGGVLHSVLVRLPPGVQSVSDESRELVLRGVLEQTSEARRA